MNKPPLLLRAMVGLTYLMILLPLVVIVGVALNGGSGYDFPPKGLSIQWFEKFFANDRYFVPFQISLQVATVTALISTSIGTLAAIAIVRLRFPGRRAAEAFLLAPLLVPEILLGAALYLAVINIGGATSVWTLIAGHVVITIPYVVRTITSGLYGSDLRIEEAAMSLGCSRIGAFIRVTLPLLRTSLISGALFAFIVSMGDINLSLFLAGTGSITLPVHIFSEIQWGSDPTVAAASTIQVLLVAVLVLLGRRMFFAR